MKTSHRRYSVYLLLFLFNAIAYLDRVNMSVAGKPIAYEFELSPIALGYLFSSFLWAYVLMMLPGGRLIDRWGTHVQNDHARSGGSRIGPRAGSGRSTPPSGSILLRIASARFPCCVGSCAKAVRRMSLASSSIDRFR